MKNQILTMLELQDAMNAKVHPEWVAQNNEWYRAIWIECAELMDHYGWKWWKHQESDIEQVRLELVDIWHFGLSDLLQNNSDKAQIAEAVAIKIDWAGAGIDLRGAVEEFASKTLVSRSFDVEAFIPVLHAADMSFEELYRQYIGKNVLNFFRQDNGYKAGTYIKVWDGKEDNEHLVEILNELDADSSSFKDDVYQGLSERYPETVV